MNLRGYYYEVYPEDQKMKLLQFGDTILLSYVEDEVFFLNHFQVLKMRISVLHSLGSTEKLVRDMLTSSTHL